MLGQKFHQKNQGAYMIPNLYGGWVAPTLAERIRYEIIAG